MEREQLDAFVHEHIRACASMLVAHLIGHPEALEGSAHTHEEVLALTVRPDPEYPDEPLEVFEHWIVDRWLAEELAERGETVGELFGLRIWGRATTGQFIAMDEVIQAIFNATTGKVQA